MIKFQFRQGKKHDLSVFFFFFIEIELSLRMPDRSLISSSTKGNTIMLSLKVTSSKRKE